MRRRGVAALALASLLGVLWWATSTSPPREEPSDPVVQPERPKVTRFRPEASAAPAPRPDEVMLQAARGELGPDYQERICELCAKGSLTGEVCAAACDEEAEPTALAEIQVDVVDEDGRPEDRARVRVTGCEVKGATDQRTFTVVAPGTCQVHAMRRDGALYARAPVTSVSVSEGGQEYVQLELTSARTGGLGVSILDDPEGIRVVAVMPGTPAAELGLQPGDVILAVNGVDTLEMDVQDFIGEMTGPEGTNVDFVIRAAGDLEAEPEPLSIVRRFLDRS